MRSPRQRSSLRPPAPCRPAPTRAARAAPAAVATPVIAVASPTARRQTRCLQRVPGQKRPFGQRGQFRSGARSPAALRRRNASFQCRLRVESTCCRGAASRPPTFNGGSAAVNSARSRSCAAPGGDALGPQSCRREPVSRTRTAVPVVFTAGSPHIRLRRHAQVGIVSRRRTPPPAIMWSRMRGRANSSGCALALSLVENGAGLDHEVELAPDGPPHRLPSLGDTEELMERVRVM